MEVIIGSRGSGRTAHCIKRASEIGGVVVVATMARKVSTEQLAKMMNCDVKIITADELFSKSCRSLLINEYKKLCIDDSDTLNYIIFTCFGLETDTITLCSSDRDNIIELESSLKLMGFID